MFKVLQEGEGGGGEGERREGGGVRGKRGKTNPFHGDWVSI